MDKDEVKSAFDQLISVVTELKREELAQRQVEWEENQRIAQEERRRIIEREGKENNLSVRLEKALIASIPLFVAAFTAIIGIYQFSNSQRDAAESQVRSAALNAATEEYKTLIQTRRDYFARRDANYIDFLRIAGKLEILIANKNSKGVDLHQLRLLREELADVMHLNTEVDNNKLICMIGAYYDTVMSYELIAEGKYDKQYGIKSELAFVNKQMTKFGEKTFSEQDAESGWIIIMTLRNVKLEMNKRMQDEVDPKQYPSLNDVVTKVAKEQEKSSY